MNSDRSLKPRRPKSREVSSRFLSPNSTSIDNGVPSPNQALSPIRRKPGTATDPRKHRSLEDSGFIRGLWPSSVTSSSENAGSLADHLGNDRLKDLLERKINGKSKTDSAQFLNRQRSSSFSRKSSSSGGSSSLSSALDLTIAPGRFSVDENALSRRPFGRKSDGFTDSFDSESDYSDICSGTDLGSPAIGKASSLSSSRVSSRNSGIEVSSKYMHDLSTRSRHGTLESNISTPLSSENSPKMRKFTLKNAIKRANSLTTYGSASSQWALSPGRSSSPAVSVENRGKPMSFSSMKPPSSPSRTKGVGNLLSFGLELFKSKKSSSNLSPVGVGTAESIYQLRLQHNGLIQWRYANAKADAVNLR